jgi:putative ABC transport system permease protein
VAVFLPVLGAVAVGHLLVTSVQRRRRDFAILKAVGFRRAQVSATVVAQATTVAGVGALLGLLAGLVVGRVLWRATAGRVGLLPSVAFPVAALAGVVVATIVIVNVVAWFPARHAARTRPAVLLRAE